MVDENNEENSWRIEKFVEGLEDMILTLKKESAEQENIDNRSNNDAFVSYVKRKDFLKRYLNTKKVNHASNKVISMQSLPKNNSPELIQNEIYQKVTNRCLEQTREQLFDRTKVSSMEQNDLDLNITDEHNVQEKIVDTMLDMVKNIKQRSIAANQIIKQDIVSAEKSSRMADVNQSQMKVNNDTLSIYNKGAYKCWLWVMLAFVFIIFFYMIMFIKIFKKKSS